MPRISALFMCLCVVALAGCGGLGSDKNPAAPSGTTSGGTPPSGGGTTTPQAPSGGGSTTTGMRTTYCAVVGAYANATWVTVPRLDGLDVKLFYNGVFQSVFLNFRNRFHDTVNFGFVIYPYGSAAPPTNSRHSMVAGRVDDGAIGYGSTSGINSGGQACVVIDKVRFGAADSGPYYNP